MDRYQSEQFLHEAGYDAYLTGYCFCKIAYKFLKEKTPDLTFTNMEEMAPFVNKLFLMSSDIVYNLEGPDGKKYITMLLIL